MLNVVLSQKGFQAEAKLNLETPKQAAELTAKFITAQLVLQRKLKDSGMGINTGIRISKPMNVSISFDDGENVCFKISMSKYKVATSNPEIFAENCGLIAEHVQEWALYAISNLK